MTDEEYARYSPWQQQMVAAEAVVSEAPAELWVSPGEGEYAGLWVEDGPGVDDEVRYVRADLYEALQARLRAALESAEDNDVDGVERILRTALKPLSEASNPR